MGEAYKPFDEAHGFAAREALEKSDRILASFSHASAIGFAILGVPAEAHLGHTVREVLGEVAGQAEPGYQRVLETGQALHFEIADGTMPARTESDYCGLNSCFPIKGTAGRVNQVGFLVVEVTEQRKLEKFFVELAGELRHTKTRENFWLARELQQSIDQYHAALSMSLRTLVANCARPETSNGHLAESVESLDQRILHMRNLVTAVACRFPIDAHPDL